MAGGIDWFRWHHGTVTDPKFSLVARRAGASLPDVLAVWAYLLETASASDERGTFTEVDCEAWDCLFGFPSTETRTADIMAAMQDRGLIGDGVVVKWDKRQPKRERDTDNSADRTRAYRERQRQHSDDKQDHVTPCDAKEHQKNARGEKSREEEKREEKTGENAPRKRSAPPAVEKPDDVDPQTWADWLALRKAKKAPVTETVTTGARREADKAGMTLEAFLQVWCRRGSQGLEAGWLKDHERSQQSETPYQRSMRLRMQEAAPDSARKDPNHPAHAADFFNAIEVPTRTVEQLP